MGGLKTVPNDTKKIFREKGTCSHTMFFILNREFGYLNENEARASDLLAGGLMQTGHQCGLLWGATLAIGAQSFRMYTAQGNAIGTAIAATQRIMESFSKRAKRTDCREITRCDFTSTFGMIKYLLTGKMFTCFNLAEKWAPEAIQAAEDGLYKCQDVKLQDSVSCASEVVRRMGANEEEIVMVAGFCGGMGLSGNACGALAAAIWVNLLEWCRKNPGKTPPYFNNLIAKNLMERFYHETDSKILCHEICGKRFKTISEHTEFIKNGGCERVIELLARNKKL